MHTKEFQIGSSVHGATLCTTLLYLFFYTFTSKKETWCGVLHHVCGEHT